MQNIKLTIAYDGTDFHGWQIQPDLPTIQGVLSEILRQLTPSDEPSPPTLHAAGRTDAGVHAWGQVANFKTISKMAPEEFLRALNALLPPAIRIRHAEQAAPDFHARYSAQAKTYRYRIYRGQVVPPFSWRYVLHHPYPLDFAAMAEAARLFEGEHDFTSFAASTGSDEEDNERTTRRCILNSKMLRQPAGREAEPEQSANSSDTANVVAGLYDDARLDAEEWIYVVRGRSFMRNMVRKMVGTLLEVGRGRLAPGDIPRILALEDRAQSGPTVPSQGLCLYSVEYPDAIVPAESRGCRTLRS